MEGNDIGVTLHNHVACMFEGLLMQADPDPVTEEETRWWQRRKKEAAPISEDEYVRHIVRKWRPNEMPLKSVIHMVNQLGIGVEVYTFLDPVFLPEIEHWLARKGVAIRAYAYDGIYDLQQDFKYNRDVHTFFTPNEDDAAILGMRATVVLPDGTFGF
jgi:hypothetical protein